MLALLLVAPAMASHNTFVAPTPAPSAVACPVGYTSQPDTDYKGNDIGKCGAHGTMAQAGTACDNDPACLGFSVLDQPVTWGASQGPWCLKSKVDTPYTIANHHFCVKTGALPPGWVAPLRCPPSSNDWGCCKSSNKCGKGEGDCDSDGDCMAGLECVDDIGDQFGGDSALDVCMPIGQWTMAPSMPPTAPDCRPSLNDWGCCGYRYQCQDGEGDCDNDSDCAAGLFCTDDIGAKYGGDALLDVCTSITRPPTPSPTYPDCKPSENDMGCCNSYSKCKSGDGDCDRDSDCADGLWCVEDYGPDFGGNPSMDICLGFGDICPPSKDDVNCCGSKTSVIGRRLYGGGYGGFGSASGLGGGNGYLCGEGEGGCQSNDDCAIGLECTANMGRRYGSSLSYMGVCTIPAGQASRCDPKIDEWSCCTEEYPCGAEQGDCDGDEDCKDGLVCVDDVGTEYGLSASFDVCRPNLTDSPTMAPTRTPTMAPTPAPTVDCTQFSKKQCKKDKIAKANCKKVKGGACMSKVIPDCAAFNVLGKKAKKACEADKNLKCSFDAKAGTCGPFNCANYSGKKSKDCDKQSPSCAYDAATKTCMVNTSCSAAGSKKDCAMMVTLGLNANCAWSAGACSGANAPTNKPTPVVCGSFVDKKACGKGGCKWDRKGSVCM